MPNVGYGTLPIIPSFSNFGPQVVQQLGSPMTAAGTDAGKKAGAGLNRGLAPGLKSAAGLIAGVFTVGIIKDFVSESIAALAKVETLNAQTQSVIKATGGAANVTADGISNLTGKLELMTGTEAESIQGGANFLLTFKNIRNEVGAGNDVFDQTIVAMTDMARATGQDMQSASLQLGKALNDPIAGVSALSRVGVQFTDQQKDQIATMVQAGDTMGAQKLILGELNSQFGGAGAAYAATYQGQMDLLGHSVGNLGETMMSGLMPVLTNLASTATAAFAWVEQNLTTVGLLAAGVGLLTGVFYATNAAMAVAAAGGLKAWLVSTKLVTAAQWLWNAALTANPLGIIIGVIVAVVAALVWFFTQTTLGQEIWTNVTNAIGAAITWLWESVLSPVFTFIGDIFTWVYNFIIIPVVTGIMLYIGIWAAIITWLWESVFSPVFGFIGAIFTWIWNTIIMPIVNYIVAYFQLLGAIANWLWVNAINPAIQGIGIVFQWLWNTIISPVASFINSAFSLIGTTAQNVFSGMADFIGAAFQAILGVVRAPVNGIIGLINNAIDGLNSLSVTIPSWVPLVGGQTWGLSLPKLPMLARGGDIAARRGGTLAILGEAGQAETVTNLGKTNRQMDATRALAEAAMNDRGDTIVRVFLGTQELTALVTDVVVEHDDRSGDKVNRGRRPTFGSRG